jgi:hypothetical protein
VTHPSPDHPADKGLAESQIRHAEIRARAALPTEEHNGKLYVRDAHNALLPIERFNARDLLQDETVRMMTGFARDLSAQMTRFKRHSFADVEALQGVLEQEYGAKAGGAKGNIQLLSIDGKLKVQVQIADRIDFGPELQVAKTLIDECLMEWGAQSHEAIRALVNRVFSVEKAGLINRNELVSLLRLEIRDERWLQAMTAIRDSFRVIGTTAYVRFYEREDANAQWRVIPLDLAKL